MSIPLPRLSRRKRGWQQGDPPVSAGKSVSQRKSARDGGLTPTERRQKASLMKQFMAGDGPRGNSPEYIASLLWCSHPGCHRTNGTHTHDEPLSERAQRMLDEGLQAARDGRIVRYDANEVEAR